MKKIFLVLIIILGVSFITGCRKKDINVEEKEESKTVASLLIETFKRAAKEEKNLEEIAKKIAESEVMVPEVQTFAIGEDEYLSGFKEEIKGFNKAYGIAPMISTIPLIAYIFEVEDTESFSKKLEQNADLRWNICTEADEMKFAIVDKYVFFVMSPTYFE